MRPTNFIRKGLLLMLSAVACSGSLHAQNTERTNPSDCPKLTVVEPAGVSQPGDLIRFEVSVDPETENLQFEWATSAGKVDEGQRTKRIGVRYVDEMKGTTLFVTVRVLGLPTGCANTAQGAAPLVWEPDIELISQFSVPVSSIHRGHLRTAVGNLYKYPNNQMYIVEYFPAATGATAIERKKKKTIAYLKGVLAFDVSRVSFVVVKNGRLQTNIYRLPPGASNPNL